MNNVHTVFIAGVLGMTGRMVISVLLTLSPALNFAADQTFVLATWNLEHLAANDGRGCRPRDASEFGAIRKYLNQARADVVAFQEIENLSAAKRVFPAADYKNSHIGETGR